MAQPTVSTFGDEELTEHAAPLVNQQLAEGVPPEDIVVDGKRLVIDQ